MRCKVLAPCVPPDDSFRESKLYRCSEKVRSLERSEQIGPQRRLTSLFCSDSTNSSLPSARYLNSLFPDLQHSVVYEPAEIPVLLWTLEPTILLFVSLGSRSSAEHIPEAVIKPAFALHVVSPTIHWTPYSHRCAGCWHWVVDCRHCLDPLPLPHHSVDDGCIQSLAYDRMTQRLEVRFWWKSVHQYPAGTPQSPAQNLEGTANEYAFDEFVMKNRRIHFDEVRSDEKLLMSLLGGGNCCPGGGRPPLGRFNQCLFENRAKCGHAGRKRLPRSSGTD